MLHNQELDGLKRTLRKAYWKCKKFIHLEIIILTLPSLTVMMNFYGENCYDS
jgi:hypothetical protein